MIDEIIEFSVDRFVIKDNKKFMDQLKLENSSSQDEHSRSF